MRVPVWLGVHLDLIEAEGRGGTMASDEDVVALALARHRVRTVLHVLRGLEHAARLAAFKLEGWQRVRGWARRGGRVDEADAVPGHLGDGDEQ